VYASIVAKVITNAGYEALDLVLCPVKKLGLCLGTVDKKSIFDCLVFSRAVNAWEENAQKDN
jgi:hypothetical protein